MTNYNSHIVLIATLQCICVFFINIFYFIDCFIIKSLWAMQTLAYYSVLGN